MTYEYEGYLHHEIGRFCHVTLSPPDKECPICFKPFEECRKWERKKKMNDLTFKELQEQVTNWTNHNFEDRKQHQALLGAMEELGELSHAHLKIEQSIRGSVHELRVLAADAIGDIIIYLADYCNVNDYDLQTIIEETWDEVKKRNWKKDPMNADEIARTRKED